MTSRVLVFQSESQKIALRLLPQTWTGGQFSWSWHPVVGMMNCSLWLSGSGLWPLTGGISWSFHLVTIFGWLVGRLVVLKLAGCSASRWFVFHPNRFFWKYYLDLDRSCSQYLISNSSQKRNLSSIPLVELRQLSSILLALVFPCFDFIWLYLCVSLSVQRNVFCLVFLWLVDEEFMTSLITW